MDMDVWHGLLDCGVQWPVYALQSADEWGDLQLVSTMAKAVAKGTGDIHGLREILESMGDVELQPLKEKRDESGDWPITAFKSWMCLEGTG